MITRERIRGQLNAHGVELRKDILDVQIGPIGVRCIHDYGFGPTWQWAFSWRRNHRWNMSWW